MKMESDISSPTLQSTKDQTYSSLMRRTLLFRIETRTQGKIQLSKDWECIKIPLKQYKTDKTHQPGRELLRPHLIHQETTISNRPSYLPIIQEYKHTTRKEIWYKVQKCLQWIILVIVLVRALWIIRRLSSRLFSKRIWRRVSTNCKSEQRMLRNIITSTSRISTLQMRRPIYWCNRIDL